MSEVVSTFSSHESDYYDKKSDEDVSFELRIFPRSGERTPLKRGRPEPQKASGFPDFTKRPRKTSSKIRLHRRKTLGSFFMGEGFKGDRGDANLGDFIQSSF